ncbi:hypothetical protein H8E77_01290, partial [bacterium]|nr:hypothetical protein [bacterium]
SRGNHALKGMAEDMGTTLTDEQRAGIQERVTEMKDAGASRQEIREVVAEMLTEYGIEVPDAWFNRLGKGNYLCADLTDEQRTAIEEKVTEMKEAGASRTEIREAVAEMLAEYGIEVPDTWFNLGTNLTDEQRTAIQEKVTEMKEAGASREEIREAVAEMLEAYGIEVPERQPRSPRSKRGAYNGTNRSANLLAMADLAMIDAQVAAAPQAAPYNTSEVTTWGKLKEAR